MDLSKIPSPKPTSKVLVTDKLPPGSVDNVPTGSIVIYFEGESKDTIMRSVGGYVHVAYDGRGFFIVVVRPNFKWLEVFQYLEAIAKEINK